MPSHKRALRFDATARPYNPVEAAEHIIAVFKECPAADKPHLLARIKMLVRDVDSMWGGFRFPPLRPEPEPHQDAPKTEEQNQSDSTGEGS